MRIKQFCNDEKNSKKKRNTAYEEYEKNVLKFLLPAVTPEI